MKEMAASGRSTFCNINIYIYIYIYTPCSSNNGARAIIIKSVEQIKILKKAKRKQDALGVKEGVGTLCPGS